MPKGYRSVAFRIVVAVIQTTGPDMNTFYDFEGLVIFVVGYPMN